MIDADIVYVRPETAEEAVLAWAGHSAPEAGGADGLRWLAGGTEIATNARKAALPSPRVLIDIKRIAETHHLEISGGMLRLGAALALNEAADSALFPLLGATVRRIADRTTRNRLSLGGNLAGSLPYREAVTTGAQSERRERPLREIFDKRLLLEPGELVLGFSLPAATAGLPWKHYRATRTASVDYPLVTACFLDRRKDGGSIEAAVSGLHPYPVLFESIQALRAAFSVPGTARTDQRATAEYRLALVLDFISRAEEELA